MFATDRLDHVGFTARDVDALAHWYETVFGMTRVPPRRGPTSTAATRSSAATARSA
jgi:hypothetical protein